MNDIKFGAIWLLLFGIVIAVTGIVCADQVVPAVPETQTLGTVTNADIVGLAMETDTGAWSLTSGGIPINPEDPVVGGYPDWEHSFWGSFQNFIVDWEADHHPDGTHLQDYLNDIILNPGDYTDGPAKAVTAKAMLIWLQDQGGLHDPPLYDKEIRYTTAYDANIVAQGGKTTFVKSMSINTGNKVTGQSNLNAQTGLTYTVTENGGNVVGSENLMIDGAGNPTNASDRMLCPFAAGTGNVIPAYCNIVQAGSAFDLTTGSVTTSANDRFVGTDATNPVVMNYAIHVKPYGTTQGQILASGSVMAYVKAHIQESRTDAKEVIPWGEEQAPWIITVNQTRAEDLTYAESSSAQGTITSFNKVIAYQSGKALL